MIVLSAMFLPGTNAACHGETNFEMIGSSLLVSSLEIILYGTLQRLMGR